MNFNEILGAIMLFGMLPGPQSSRTIQSGCQ